MLSSKGRVKIIDFGLAETKAGTSVSTKLQPGGTIQYLPPEYFEENFMLNHKVDNYAFGVTINELLIEERPYTNPPVDDRRLQFKIASGSHPEICSSGPPGLLKVITKCLNKDPSKRPEFDRILSLEKDIMLLEELVAISDRDRTLDPKKNGGDRSNDNNDNEAVVKQTGETSRETKVTLTKSINNSNSSTSQYNWHDSHS